MDTGENAYLNAIAIVASGDIGSEQKSKDLPISVSYLLCRLIH